MPPSTQNVKGVGPSDSWPVDLNTAEEMVFKYLTANILSIPRAEDLYIAKQRCWSSQPCYAEISENEERIDLAWEVAQLALANANLSTDSASWDNVTLDEFNGATSGVVALWREYETKFNATKPSSDERISLFSDISDKFYALLPPKKPKDFPTDEELGIKKPKAPPVATEPADDIKNDGQQAQVLKTF